MAEYADDPIGNPFDTPTPRRRTMQGESECGGDSIARHAGCDRSGHMYKEHAEAPRFRCTVCPHTAMQPLHSGGVEWLQQSTTPALPSEPEVLTCVHCGMPGANVVMRSYMERRKSNDGAITMTPVRRACHLHDGECFDAVKSDRDALRARCAQLEGDAKLIDFVQANHYSVMCWDVNGQINNGFTIGSDNGEMDDIAAGRTWRECVQWAMKRAARSTPTSGESVSNDGGGK